MNKNVFIGIGAQKAGTTWLAKYFDRHPDVTFSPIKEVHYFDSLYSNKKIATKNIISRFQKKIAALNPKKVSKKKVKEIQAYCYRMEMVYDENAYVDYFNWLKNKRGKLVGEITPAYSVLNKDGFVAMKRLFGDQLKILFILRNPVDRHWSQLKYREKRSQSFNAKINFLNTLTNGVPLRNNYKRTIEHLNKVFKQEQVHIMFYENLFNPSLMETELEKLCTFLNIRNINPVKRKHKVNSSKKKSLNSDDRKKAVLIHSDIYRYIIDNFENTPEEWLADYNQIKLN